MCAEPGRENEDFGGGRQATFRHGCVGDGKCWLTSALANLTNLDCMG